MGTSGIKKGGLRKESEEVKADGRKGKGQGLNANTVVKRLWFVRSLSKKLLMGPHGFCKPRWLVPHIPSQKYCVQLFTEFLNALQNE